MTSLPHIFFIGVGNMGHPMAANLLKAGYPLTVYDIAPDKAQILLAQGAFMMKPKDFRKLSRWLIILFIT